MYLYSYLYGYAMYISMPLNAPFKAIYIHVYMYIWHLLFRRGIQIGPPKSMHTLECYVQDGIWAYAMRSSALGQPGEGAASCKSPAGCRRYTD